MKVRNALIAALLAAPAFADTAATVTELLGVEYKTPGTSFASEII